MSDTALNPEAELAEIERACSQYEEFLFYLPDALVELDLDSWQVTSMNRMARLQFGYPQEGPPGPVNAFAHIDPSGAERAAELTNELVAESRAKRTPYERVNEPQPIEILLRRDDGSTFIAELNSSFVLDREGIPVSEFVYFRDITDRSRREAERIQLLADLQEALANVKTLSGLLPICAICKSVRDDRGYWTQIESYVRKHSDADFEHGLCKNCRAEMYGAEPDDA